MSNKQSDIEVISSSFENVFNGIDECFEAAIDDKKNKMNVVGSIFKLGKSMAGLSWNLGKCAVKHTPKALATVAAVKREIVTAIEEEVCEHKKQLQQDALDTKIKALKIKSTKEHS